MAKPLYWNWPRIQAEVNRSLGRGIAAAAAFLTARVKEILSIPAPRKTVISGTGVRYYRAMTKAKPGAPPRKLSGRMRQSITFEVAPDGLSARVGTNLKPYPKVHELGKHPWLLRTVRMFRGALERIIGGP